MKSIVARVAADYGAAVAEVDVDGDPELQRLYSDEVPVLLVDGKKFAKYRVSELRLRGKLARLSRRG
jgi:hypothetical protein